MFELQGSIVNGLTLGIEHFSFDDDENEPADWGIAIHLLIFRILLLKYKVE